MPINEGMKQYSRLLQVRILWCVSTDELTLHQIQIPHAHHENHDLPLPEGSLHLEAAHMTHLGASARALDLAWNKSYA